MKKAKDILLAVLGSDAFAVMVCLALAYGYIKRSLVVLEYMAR